MLLLWSAIVMVVWLAMLLYVLRGCRRLSVRFRQPRHPSPPKNDNSPERQIKNMTVDESLWTTPWAMYRDENNNYQLNGQYTCRESPGGTVSMLVRRTATGYQVDVTRDPSYRWHKSPPMYTGAYEPLRVEQITAVNQDGSRRIAADLPAHYFQRELRELTPGESAWTTWWALYAERRGEHRLNGNYCAHQDRDGNICMIVHRTNDGWEVDISHVSPGQTWSLGANYCGEFEPLAVSQVKGGTINYD